MLLQRFIFLSVVVCLGGAGFIAHADDSHYQDFIVGGRAMVLGGAFTSIANDHTGVYYNPAGLVDVGKKSVQAAMSLYGFERGSLDEKGALPVPGGEDSVSFTDIIIVPASAGSVKRIGAPLPNGRSRHAYGISVVVPSFRSYAASSPSTVSTDNTNPLLIEQPTRYLHRTTDRSLWSGFGYGFRFSDRLSFGVSGYYLLRSLIDTEDVATSASINDGDGDPSNDQQVFHTATNDISLISGSVLLIGGVKFRVTDRLTVGAAVQSPSLRVHSQANLRFTSGSSVPNCPEQNCSDTLGAPRSKFVSESIAGEVDTSYPVGFRFGASYVEPYRYTISVDGSIYGAASYSLLRSNQLTDELRGRLPFNPDITRNPVVNINIGGEYLLVREVSAGAGFFTDFSSAPKIKEAFPKHDQLARANLLGVTFSLGYFAKHSLSRLGLMYSWGAGQDVIPTNDLGRLMSGSDEQQFKRVDYFQSFFYIFLSNTFRY